MIGVSASLLDVRALERELDRAVDRGMEDAARAIVDIHREALESGQTPDGATQSGHGSGKDPRPLYETGRLARETTARRTRDGWEIIPPADRIDALERAHARGQVTIFSLDASPRIDRASQAAIDEHVEKIRPGDHEREIRA